MAKRTVFLAGAKNAHGLPISAGFGASVEFGQDTVTSITLVLLSLALITFFLYKYFASSSEKSFATEVKEPQGDGKGSTDDKRKTSGAVDSGWFEDLTKAVGGRPPRCQNCLKRVTIDAGLSICTLCSSWICSGCLCEHEERCNRVVVICTRTCAECSQAICGLIDCVRSLHTHHVCGLCMQLYVEYVHSNL